MFVRRARPAPPRVLATRRRAVAASSSPQLDCRRARHERRRQHRPPTAPPRRGRRLGRRLRARRHRPRRRACARSIGGSADRGRPRRRRRRVLRASPNFDPFSKAFVLSRGIVGDAARRARRSPRRSTSRASTSQTGALPRRRRRCALRDLPGAACDGGSASRSRTRRALERSSTTAVRCADARAAARGPQRRRTASRAPRRRPTRERRCWRDQAEQQPDRRRALRRGARRAARSPRRRSTTATCIPLERRRARASSTPSRSTSTRCTGCKACVTACHTLNGLDDGEIWRTVGLLHGGTRAAPGAADGHHRLPPLRRAGLPERLPGQRLREGPGDRHRQAPRRPVHRLPVLHAHVPVRRAEVQRGARHRAQVRHVQRPAGARRGAGLRAGLPERGDRDPRRRPARSRSRPREAGAFLPGAPDAAITRCRRPSTRRSAALPAQPAAGRLLQRAARSTRTCRWS